MREEQDIRVGRTARQTYIFRVKLIEEEDGRWSAGIPSLPGCATWGATREEVLRNIQDAAEAYVRDMQKAGQEVPKDATLQVIKEPAVAVTV